MVIKTGVTLTFMDEFNVFPTSWSTLSSIADLIIIMFCTSIRSLIWTYQLLFLLTPDSQADLMLTLSFSMYDMWTQYVPRAGDTRFESQHMLLNQLLLWLCAQAHLLVYFSKSVRGFGRFGEISPFVGFGPQTTMDGKWADTNAASTLKISGPWAKPPTRKFDFCEVFFCTSRLSAEISTTKAN